MEPSAKKTIFLRKWAIHWGLQSSLDPWYLELSSCLNHGQTKTAMGRNIILSNNNKNRGTKEVTQGQNRDSLGQDRNDQGQNRDRGIIRQTPYNSSSRVVASIVCDFTNLSPHHVL